MKAKRPIVPHPTDPTLALVELTKGHWSVIDAAYAAEVGKYSWSALTQPGSTVYAQRGFRVGPRKIGKQKSESLHVLIGRLCGLRCDQTVDHINGNGLDNRSANLRDASNAQNIRNAGIRSTNRSGVKGVYFDRRAKKFYAAVMTDRRRKYLGPFNTVSEAAIAVRSVREDLHGAFANHGPECPQGTA